MLTRKFSIVYLALTSVSSWLLLNSQGARAAEYKFKFVADEILRTEVDFSAGLNEETSIIPGPVLVGTGSLVFDSREIDFSALGTQDGQIPSTLIPLDLLGPSAILTPFEGASDSFISQGLFPGAAVKFKGTSDGLALVGANFVASFSGFGGTYGFQDIETRGTTFSLLEGWVNTDSYLSQADSTGKIVFETVVASELEVVPEPLMIVGTLGALGFGLAMKKRAAK